MSKLSVGPMDNNAYVLTCTETGDAVLIDAANEADRLLALIGDRPLRTIITTHQHWDHWQALPEVQAATGADTVAHPADAGELPIPVTASYKRRHGAGRHLHPLGDPLARPHAGQHRAAL